MYGVVSSANKILAKEITSKWNEKSFIKMRKRSGPKIEPYGTPNSNPANLENICQALSAVIYQ
jgi:hypothetical protein